MSATVIDGAIATAVQGLIAGAYRQQSDERQDREQVDPVNPAYQLLVSQTDEDLTRNGNQPTREYSVLLRVKKHVANASAERNWRLGGMATALESLLTQQFYRDLDVSPGNPLFFDREDEGQPSLDGEPELVGRVYSFVVTMTVLQAV